MSAKFKLGLTEKFDIKLSRQMVYLTVAIGRESIVLALNEHSTLEDLSKGLAKLSKSIRKKYINV
jgi:hypothetical protein